MIACNFYGEAGKELRPGDIVFLMSAYTSVYKDKMVLYQSNRGGIYRLRDFFFVQGVGAPNMSEIDCVREIDNKGKEIFKFKAESREATTGKNQPDSAGGGAKTHSSR